MPHIKLGQPSSSIEGSDDGDLQPLNPAGDSQDPRSGQFEVESQASSEPVRAGTGDFRKRMDGLRRSSIHSFVGTGQREGTSPDRLR